MACRNYKYTYRDLRGSRSLRLGSHVDLRQIIYNSFNDDEVLLVHK